MLRLYMHLGEYLLITRADMSVCTDLSIAQAHVCFMSWPDVPQRGLHGGLLRVRMEHLESKFESIC